MQIYNNLVLVWFGLLYDSLSETIKNFYLYTFYTIKFINEQKSRTPYEDRPEPSNPGSVDAFINYLETPLANRTGIMDLTRLLPLIPIKKKRGGTKRKQGGKNKRTKKIMKIKKTKKQRKNSKRQTKHR